MAPKKLPTGRWQVRWRDGSGHQRSQNFVYKADAVAAETTILGDLQRGSYIPPAAGRTILRAWADDWLTGALNLGDGGRDTYRRDLDRYILPELGDRKLRTLTATVIETYLAGELDRGLAPSTVHRHYRTLRRMLQVAVDRNLLAKNPCDPVTPPRIPHRDMRFLDPQEIEALAKTIPDRYRAWLYVATYAGLRWSELVGLRRRHVDGNRITIAEQLIRRADGEWHRDQPKTRAGRRSVTLPPFVAKLLEEHLKKWEAPGPDGLVFANQLGNPLNGPSFRSNVFMPACAKAGLGTIVKKKGQRTRYVTDVRIHDLRHTAVALAIAVGAHPKAIQARMGHASITMTLDRYGHLFPEMDETIADRLQDLRVA